jgi:type 1 glutamine amidotransferase
MNPIKTAVVTGGHSYDVPNFHRLFRALPGLDVYIQHMDDFASSPVETRDAYDVVLFYTMLREGPADEGQTWYQGKPKTALEHLGETRQGIVVLHHALLAYPQWQQWSDIVGVQERTFGYYMAQTVNSQIANSTHPITQGMSAWEMVDETYTMPSAGADSTVLITYDHPKSMRSIAWTRTYKHSRVFCYQAGHDNITWVIPQFQTLLNNGIHWAAETPRNSTLPSK